MVDELTVRLPGVDLAAQDFNRLQFQHKLALVVELRLFNDAPLLHKGLQDKAERDNGILQFAHDAVVLLQAVEFLVELHW